MNIFDQLRDIISDKTNKISEDCELEKEFVPFMVQRWLSFYSNNFAQLINNSSNVLWKSFDNKQIWYKFFWGIIPKNRFKNIKYIKKDKEAKIKTKINDEIVSYLSERLELSKREINQYLELNILDIKTLKKQLENN